MKSKNGEPSDNMYMTSFRIPIKDSNGNKFMVQARVTCPDSQFKFYRLIGLMLDRKMLTPFQHLTAEFLMFRAGHVLAA